MTDKAPEDLTVDELYAELTEAPVVEKYVFRFSDDGRTYYKKGDTWYCAVKVYAPKFYECTNEGEPLVEVPLPPQDEFDGIFVFP